MNKKWLSKDLIGFSLTSFFNDFCHEMTTSLLPAFIEQIIGPAKAPLALGLIMGFADASSTVMKLLSGWLADHITYFKPIIVFGYFITSVFVSIIGSATNTIQVFLYQTIAWMGRGLREPMRDVWLTNITPRIHYGKVFGFERACDTLGAIAGPTLAFFTIQLFALNTNFYIAFIPGFISVCTVIFLTSNYKAPQQATTMPSLTAHIKTLPSNFIFFVLTMFIFGLSNFHKTLIIFRAQEMLLGEAPTSIIATSWALLLYVLYNVLRAIGELGVGGISDYVNRKFLMASGFGLFALATLCLLCAQGQIPLWIIIFTCAGLSAGIITAVEKSYAAQLLPEELRGIGFGVLQSADGCADLLSSVVVGGLWTLFAAEVAFMYSAMLSISSLVLIFFLKK